MKAILMPILPKWCELIASGKKTTEVRKTRPKIETPFKCYIYCTKAKDKASVDGYTFFADELYIDYYSKTLTCGHTQFEEILNGKVIGEFVCNKIEEIRQREVFNADVLCSTTCLTIKEFLDYIGNATAYFWHISDLVIYNEPKDLSEFYAKCNKFDLDKKEVYEAHCTDCGNENGIAPCEYINKKWCIPVTKPPQSWRYVETEN